MVIALGAVYDLNTTPGLNEGGNEFYSFAGAARLRAVIPTFSMGHANIGLTSVGTPKAGVFSEGAARVVAASLIADLQGGEQPSGYDGAGSCYVEFGADRVGPVDVDFLSGPTPTGSFLEPSIALADEKQQFGSSRRARWFGL